MTKTISVDVTLCCAIPGLPVMILISKTLEGLFVWNFEFGALGFI